MTPDDVTPHRFSRAEADRWFLDRGMPQVLPRGERAHRLLERSAPLVVALAVLGVITLVGLLLPDTTDEDFEDSDVDGWLLVGYVAFVASVVALPPLAGWATARLIDRAGPIVGRWFALVMIVFLVVAIPFLQDDVVPTASFVSDAVVNVGTVLVAVWLTYLGAGSILSWAVRFAVAQVAALGTLAGRALPLIVLTVLVFFTGELWQLCARVPRQRIWWTIAFLMSICILFLVTTLGDEVREIRARHRDGDEAQELLARSPFAGSEAIGGVRSLSRSEKVNVLLVLFLAQFIQIIVFAVVIFAFFLGLGLIALPPDVIEVWSGVPSGQGTWFGVQVPVAAPLINMSLIVSALSAMYFTVSASTDPTYRTRFFDPLVEDMAVTLAAREAYIATWFRI